MEPWRTTGVLGRLRDRPSRIRGALLKPGGPAGAPAWAPEPEPGRPVGAFIGSLSTRSGPGASVAAPAPHPRLSPTGDPDSAPDPEAWNAPEPARVNP